MMLKSLQVLDVDYAYLDSGPPASPHYTTWVFLHGLGFNGGLIVPIYYLGTASLIYISPAVFEKLLPLAHAHDLRIITVYRRGYPPSSRFRGDELAGIGFKKGTNETEPFFRAQGTEIATFLVKFTAEQRIPLADLDNRIGGIALIGWSLAGIHVLASLAYLDELPVDTQGTLRKYLHTVVFHDASAFALGIPNTPKHDVNIWLEVDDRKRFDAFFDWATAHYIHKSVISENVDDLEFNSPSSEVPRSLHELSYVQRSEYTHLEGFSYTGCDGKLLVCDTSAFAALTKRALFDKARAEKSPRVRVRFMSGGTSAGVLVWALWMLRKYAESPGTLYGSEAEKARDIKFVTQAEGNHFIFWEEPEKAIQQYSVAISL